MAQGSARYERSAAGMVGAMIITLLVILAFVVFRAINRDELVVEREAVDYLPMVEGLQAGDDLDPAYPAALPEGWTATRAVYDAENLAWELDVLTDDGKYVGLRQATIRAKDLIEEYVDDEGEPDGVTSFDGGLDVEWEQWRVDGDDTAYTTVLADEAGLLVFGGAPAADVRAFAETLVQEPIAR